MGIDVDPDVVKKPATLKKEIQRVTSRLSELYRSDAATSVVHDSNVKGPTKHPSNTSVCYRREYDRSDASVVFRGDQDVLAGRHNTSVQIQWIDSHDDFWSQGIFGELFADLLFVGTTGT